MTKPSTIHCPVCQRKLRCPSAGTKGRTFQCPVCGAKFVEEPSRPIPGLVIDPQQSVQPLPATPAIAGGFMNRPGRIPLTYSALRPNKPLRQTMAFAGFIAGAVLCASSFASDAIIDPELFWDAHTIALGLFVGPISVGGALACLGFATGLVFEMLIRLACRKPGDSVLLAIVGDDELD